MRYHRREYDQALSIFRQKLTMAPDDPWGYIGAGQSLIFMGEDEAGLAEIRSAIEVSPDYSVLLCYLAWGYGRLGRIDDARQVVAEMEEEAEQKPISPMAFAWAYTEMGQKDQAIDWLEKAYETRDGTVIMLRVPEFYDVLSSEPRYHALLAKMGLEA